MINNQLKEDYLNYRKSSKFKQKPNNETNISDINIQLSNGTTYTNNGGNQGNRHSKGRPKNTE